MTQDKVQAKENLNSKKPEENGNGGKVGKIVNIVINTVLIISIIFAAICTYVSFCRTSCTCSYLQIRLIMYLY